MDSVTVEGTSLVVRGYGFDPDSAGQINIVMAIDQVGTKLSLHRANEYRPDVGRAIRGRTYSGFTARSVPLAPGNHVMCIAAQNVGRGAPWRLFGCKYFDVGDPNPTGNFESLVSQGDRFVASGWTLDRQTPIPNEVRVDVDSVPVARVRAMDVRDDVAAAFPGLGNLHGFRVTVPITPGSHWVCAVGVNLDVGSDVLLGCKWVSSFAIQPFGVLDQVEVEGSAVVARGWAIDPDVAAGAVVVAVARRSPLIDPTTKWGTATELRVDVGQAHGTDSHRGFTVAMTDLEPGLQTVCIVVSNRGYGGDGMIGCRDVFLPDRRPSGGLTAVEAVSGGLRVQGTADDPDSSSPVSVRIIVDGVVRATVPANGGGGSFDETVSGLGSGGHSVCVVAIDQPGSSPGRTGDKAFTCGGVSLGGLSVGTTGEPTVIGAVGPPIGHPLRNMERDAGVSTELGDGSSLWFFGDSSELDAAGNLKYFVSGTAAWTSAGSPTVTNDAAPGGRPVTFATPVTWNGPCPANAPNAVMWPMSAVRVPPVVGGTTDRVLVYMEDVCLGQFTGQSRGMALVAIDVNTSSPPSGVPIVGTVLNQFVRTQRTYGTSSMFDGTYVYAYSCGPPIDGGWFTDYGPCHASRVLPGSAHVTAAYEYWNGSGWSSSEAAAASLTMPDLRTQDGGTIPVIPVASFTTRKVPGQNQYVMVYSPWPGFTDQVVVRVASSPVGPWSAPLQVFLPNCRDSIGGKQYLCYAGTAQPQFDATGAIGIGYFDQLVATGPIRGAYMVARVPLRITP